MIEKETFCGAVEVFGIARLCNIPLTVLSFKQDRTSVQIVSFNFRHECLTNHVLYVGHVSHEIHKFFPLRKGKILFLRVFVIYIFTFDQKLKKKIYFLKAGTFK